MCLGVNGKVSLLIKGCLWREEIEKDVVELNERGLVYWIV